MNVFNLENHLNIFFNKDIFLRNIFSFFYQKFDLQEKAKLLHLRKIILQNQQNILKKEKKY